MSSSLPFVLARVTSVSRMGVPVALEVLSLRQGHMEHTHNSVTLHWGAPVRLQLGVAQSMERRWMAQVELAPEQWEHVQAMRPDGPLRWLSLPHVPAVRIPARWESGRKVEVHLYPREMFDAAQVLRRTFPTADAFRRGLALAGGLDGLADFLCVEHEGPAMVQLELEMLLAQVAVYASDSEGLAAALNGKHDWVTDEHWQRWRAAIEVLHPQAVQFAMRPPQAAGQERREPEAPANVAYERQVA